jgi:uncharacterized protein (TIRG00374 family)
VSVVVSLVVLWALYRSLDVGRLGEVFSRASPLWLTVSIGAIVPIKLLQSWRLRRLIPEPIPLSYLESFRLILLADVMNLLLPSKAGDLAKSWFMRGKGELSGSLALSLVVFEKACDVLALFAWCAIGLLVTPGKGRPLELLTWGVTGALAGGLLLLLSRRFAGAAFGAARALAPRMLQPRIERLGEAWEEVRGHFRSRRARTAEIAALSLLLWGLQFEQVRLFALAVGGRVPVLANLGLAPLAILAGLMPLTFAGLGTRDAALVVLYRPWLPPAAAAAVGLLTGTRYLLPALAGLPLFRRALAARAR